MLLTFIIGRLRLHYGKNSHQNPPFYSPSTFLERKEISLNIQDLFLQKFLHTLQLKVVILPPITLFILLIKSMIL